ncbi:MAG: XrtA system polysaccharide chain length determinant [Pseudomonadota bacterium]
MPASNDDSFDLRGILDMVEGQVRGTWRYKWRALAVAWVVALFGWFSVYSMPDTYEATARIYVDTENAIRPFVEGLAPTQNVLSEVAIVTREMLSRPNLAKVARETDLDLRADSDREFEGLLSSLQERISVSGNLENVFSISFEDADRDKAVAVVESLVNTFVEDSLVADRNESGTAQIFLEDKIVDYEARLTEAEDRLAQFKRENVAYMPNQQGDFFARLQAAQGNLSETESRLRLAQQRREELLRQIEGEVPVFGTVDAVPGSLDGDEGFSSGKIAELEAQLEELRLVYTDKHPRIGQITETIELLRRQQADAAAARDPDDLIARSNPLDRNPVYQNMKIQLGATELEIVELQALAVQYRQAVARLSEQVNTIPQVEAELSRLNRDYDVVKRNYEQFLQQLEAANIGNDIDETIDDVQFRIIDPPFSAQTPVGPPRVIFLSVVLVAALGIGGAVGLAFNLLNPVFFTGTSLTALSGIPVLGAVQLVQDRSTRRTKRLEHMAIAGALVVLVVVFVGAIMFAEQAPELMNRIQAG